MTSAFHKTKEYLLAQIADLTSQNERLSRLIDTHRTSHADAVKRNLELDETAWQLYVALDGVIEDWQRGYQQHEVPETMKRAEKAMERGKKCIAMPEEKPEK